MITAQVKVAADARTGPRDIAVAGTVKPSSLVIFDTVDGILFTARILSMPYQLRTIVEWRSPNFQDFLFLEGVLLLMLGGLAWIVYYYVGVRADDLGGKGRVRRRLQQRHHVRAAAGDQYGDALASHGVA